MRCGESLQQMERSIMWWVGDWLNYGERRYGEMYAQAVDATGYENGTLRTAKWVAGSFELSMRMDNLTWTHHQIVAALPSDERAALLTKAGRDGWTCADLRREMRHTSAKAIAPPAGKFSTIVIDPPWEVEKIERYERPNQARLDYATMTEDELTDFGETVDGVAHDDCHLFMWTTHKHFPLALRLLDAWEWKYVLAFVWHKPGGFQPVGLPQYNCEFCLYARRGAPEFRDTKELPVCFNAPRGAHSEKPEKFYEMLRRVTAGPRLDMFSRRQIDGFDGWGNESG